MVNPPKTTIFTIEMNTGSTIVQVKYCFTLSNESLYINYYIIYNNINYLQEYQLTVH